MKIVKVKYLILLFSCVHMLGLLNIVHAQDIKPLSIGDKCPDFLLQGLINYETSAAKLSELKSKLVILDFGATNCPPCITGAIEFSSSEFKERFKDSVTVVWVVPENKQEIETFLKSKQLGKKITIPIATSRPLSFLKYFPQTYLGTQVWVSNGKIVAFDETLSLSQKDLSRALRGENIYTKRTNEFFDPRKQEFVVLNQSALGDEILPKCENYSIVTGQLSGMNWTANIWYTEADRQRGWNQLFLKNASILDLYQAVFTGLGSNLNYHTNFILEVKDPSTYNLYDPQNRKDGIYSNTQEWQNKYTHCYSSRFKMNTPVKDVYTKALYDLDFAFGTKGRIENRLVDCWVITRHGKAFESPKDSIFMSKNPDSSYTSLYSKLLSKQHGYFRASDIKGFVENINGHAPVLNEVMDIEWMKKSYVRFSREGLENVTILNNELSRYGISITIEKRKLPMLVITENGYQDNIEKQKELNKY